MEAISLMHKRKHQDLSYLNKIATDFNSIESSDELILLAKTNVKLLGETNVKVNIYRDKSSQLDILAIEGTDIFEVLPLLYPVKILNRGRAIMIRNKLIQQWFHENRLDEIAIVPSGVSKTQPIINEFQGDRSNFTVDWKSLVEDMKCLDSRYIRESIVELLYHLKTSGEGVKDIAEMIREIGD